MFTKLLKRIPLAGVTALLLLGCSKEAPPADESAAAADSTSQKAKPDNNAEAYPPVAGTAPELDRERNREPELEGEIDAFFSERGELGDMVKLMTDPVFQEMMTSMMKDWEPDETLEQRMMSAMQILATVKMPESPLATAENPKDLEGSGMELQIGTDDPQLMREIVGHVLNQDPAGFMETFCRAMEDSAVESAIDPESKGRVFMNTTPPADGGAGSPDPPGR